MFYNTPWQHGHNDGLSPVEFEKRNQNEASGSLQKPGRFNPVTEAERMRNDTIYSFQGNRNPFVDHPEWVACVYQSICN